MPAAREPELRIGCRSTVRESLEDVAIGKVCLALRSGVQGLNCQCLLVLLVQRLAGLTVR